MSSELPEMNDRKMLGFGSLETEVSVIKVDGLMIQKNLAHKVGNET